MVTQSEFTRLVSIARRNDAGDDAPDIAQSAIVQYLSLPQPLTRLQVEQAFNTLAMFVTFAAKNHGKRQRRQAPAILDIRVTYADRLVARERAALRRAMLALVTPEERALILAPRGTVSPSDRVKRQRLLVKLRARLA